MEGGLDAIIKLLRNSAATSAQYKASLIKGVQGMTAKIHAAQDQYTNNIRVFARVLAHMKSNTDDHERRLGIQENNNNFLINKLRGLEKQFQHSVQKVNKEVEEEIDNEVRELQFAEEIQEIDQRIDVFRRQLEDADNTMEGILSKVAEAQRLTDDEREVLLGDLEEEVLNVKNKELARAYIELSDARTSFHKDIDNAANNKVSLLETVAKSKSAEMLRKMTNEMSAMMAETAKNVQKTEQDIQENIKTVPEMVRQAINEIYQAGGFATTRQLDKLRSEITKLKERSIGGVGGGQTGISASKVRKIAEEILKEVNAGTFTEKKFDDLLKRDVVAGDGITITPQTKGIEISANNSSIEEKISKIREITHSTIFLSDFFTTSVEDGVTVEFLKRDEALPTANRDAFLRGLNSQFATLENKRVSVEPGKFIVIRWKRSGGGQDAEGEIVETMLGNSEIVRRNEYLVSGTDINRLNESLGDGFTYAQFQASEITGSDQTSYRYIEAKKTTTLKYIGTSDNNTDGTGGLTEVTHDTSLDGKGTTGDPLKIKDAGVKTKHVGDNQVTEDKLADAINTKITSAQTTAANAAQAAVNANDAAATAQGSANNAEILGDLALTNADIAKVESFSTSAEYVVGKVIYDDDRNLWVTIKSKAATDTAAPKDDTDNRYVQLADDFLSDADIGDKAFKNPPSTLSAAQKEAVRDLIGAVSSASTGVDQTARDEATHNRERISRIEERIVDIDEEGVDPNQWQRAGETEGGMIAVTTFPADLAAAAALFTGANANGVLAIDVSTGESQKLVFRIQKDLKLSGIRPDIPDLWQFSDTDYIGGIGSNVSGNWAYFQKEVTNVSGSDGTIELQKRGDGSYVWFGKLKEKIITPENLKADTDAEKSAFRTKIGVSGTGNDSGGLSAVASDDTLKGDGTTGKPLGLADGAVGSTQLKVSAVNTAHLHDGAATEDKLSTDVKNKLNSVVVSDSTLKGDGTTGKELGVADNAITEDKLSQAVKDKLNDDTPTEDEVTRIYAQHIVFNEESASESNISQGNAWKVVEFTAEPLPNTNTTALTKITTGETFSFNAGISKNVRNETGLSTENGYLVNTSGNYSFSVNGEFSVNADNAGVFAIVVVKKGAQVGTLIDYAVSTNTRRDNTVVGFHLENTFSAVAGDRIMFMTRRYSHNLNNNGSGAVSLRTGVHANAILFLNVGGEKLLGVGTVFVGESTKDTIVQTSTHIIKFTDVSESVLGRDYGVITISDDGLIKSLPTNGLLKFSEGFYTVHYEIDVPIFTGSSTTASIKFSSIAYTDEIKEIGNSVSTSLYDEGVLTFSHTFKVEDVAYLSFFAESSNVTLYNLRSSRVRITRETEPNAITIDDLSENLAEEVDKIQELTDGDDTVGEWKTTDNYQFSWRTANDIATQTNLEITTSAFNTIMRNFGNPFAETYLTPPGGNTAYIWILAVKDGNRNRDFDDENVRLVTRGTDTKLVAVSEDNFVKVGTFEDSAGDEFSVWRSKQQYTFAQNVRYDIEEKVLRIRAAKTIVNTRLGVLSLQQWVDLHPLYGFRASGREFVPPIAPVRSHFTGSDNLMRSLVSTADFEGVDGERELLFSITFNSVSAAFVHNTGGGGTFYSMDLRSTLGIDVDSQIYGGCWNEANERLYLMYWEPPLGVGNPTNFQIKDYRVQVDQAGADVIPDLVEGNAKQISINPSGENILGVAAVADRFLFLVKNSGAPKIVSVPISGSSGSATDVETLSLTEGNGDDSGNGNNVYTGLAYDSKNKKLYTIHNRLKKALAFNVKIDNNAFTSITRDTTSDFSVGDAHIVEWHDNARVYAEYDGLALQPRVNRALYSVAGSTNIYQTGYLKESKPTFTPTYERQQNILFNQKQAPTSNTVEGATDPVDLSGVAEFGFRFDLRRNTPGSGVGGGWVTTDTYPENIYCNNIPIYGGADPWSAPPDKKSGESDADYLARMKQRFGINDDSITSISALLDNARDNFVSSRSVYEKIWFVQPDMKATGDIPQRAVITAFNPTIRDNAYYIPMVLVRASDNTLVRVVVGAFQKTNSTSSDLVPVFSRLEVRYK